MLHKLTRRLTVLCLSAACLATAAGVQAAPPEVLNLAPANPAAVLVVPNMRTASDRIAAANQLVGANMPQLDDLASQFRQSLGVLRGMRDDGAFMLVLTDASSLGGDKQAGVRPAIILVLPVDDYATFLGNFKATATEGVTAIELPRGRPGFAKLQGQYALVSPRKDLLDRYAPANAAAALAQQAGLLGAKAIENNDVTLIIDSKAMKPIIEPMLKATEQDQRRAGARPPFVEALGNGWIGTLLAESRMITLGMKLDDEVVELDVTAQFAPDSEMGKKLVSGGGGKPALLATIPDRPYVMAFWADLSNKYALDVMQNFAGKPLANAGGAASEAVVFNANTKAIALAAYAPRELAFGQSLLNMVAVVESDQPRTFIGNFQKYITAANGQSMVYKFPRGKSGVSENIRLSTQYGNNALSLNNVSIDQFRVNYDIPPAVIDAIGPAGPIFMLVAGSSQSGYVGSVGKHTVITSRTDSQLVNDTFGTAANTSGIGTSRSLQSIADRLPERSVMQWYISAAGVVQMYNTMSTVHQLPALPVPLTAEPVAIGVGADASGMNTRLVLPISVLRYLQETATSMIQPEQQPMAQQDQGPQRPARASQMPPSQQGNARGPQGVRSQVPASQGPASQGGASGRATPDDYHN